MPAKFVNVDRQSPMLLSCDLTEWVKDIDLVHFILEVVESCDLNTAHRLSPTASTLKWYKGIDQGGALASALNAGFQAAPSP